MFISALITDVNGLKRFEDPKSTGSSRVQNCQMEENELLS